MPIGVDDANLNTGEFESMFGAFMSKDQVKFLITFPVA